MKTDLHNKRKDYKKDKIEDHLIETDPFVWFQKWYKEAEDTEENTEAHAMTLSTVSKDGQPMARVVLLRCFSTDGLDFYTNYNSRKGKHLAQNPRACLSFFWPYLERQLIVVGKVEKLSAEMSTNYFNQRPLESRIAAIASDQSSELESRSKLESRWRELSQKKEIDITRPPHWGGYRLIPQSFEFWQGGSNRLHDRFLFEKLNGKWENQRLYP